MVDRVQAGGDGPVVRVQGDDVPRGMARVDRHGGIEGTRTLGIPSSPENVPRPIAHQDVGGTEADGVLAEQVVLTPIANGGEAMLDVPDGPQSPREIVVAARDVRSEIRGVPVAETADEKAVGLPG